MMYLIGVIFASLLHYGFSQNLGDCKCVSFHLCRQESGTIITDGEGLVTERIGDLCPTCDCKGNDICCSLGNGTLPTPTIRTISKGCGFHNPDGVGFKVGVDGTDALFGEFPWMIGIFENQKYRCGGSLIDPSVVLTAAHCVKLDSSAYSLRAGEWDSGSIVENLRHQDRTVDSIKIHENFNPKNYQNDIALVFLSQPFKLAAHIDVACLVPSKTTVSNVRCYATGWGKDRFGTENTGVPILKKVDLPMIAKSACQEDLRKTRLGQYFILDQSFTCAGGEKDKDTCKGDGGGPLVCPIDGTVKRYQQVGITAWGIGCNDENVPGVYTDVAVFRDWIDKQMQDKNFLVSGYQYSATNE